MLGEERKLEIRIGRMEPSLMRSVTMALKFQEEAKKKNSDEEFEIERKALRVIKNHQKQKNMSNQEIVAEFDSNKDDKIDEAELAAFFENKTAPVAGKDAEESMNAQEIKRFLS